jgi:cell division protease FtsH
MVADYAMGTQLHSQRVDGELSEDTLRIQDGERRDLADAAYRAARSLIQIHHAQLDDLAQTLLRREMLERADIDRVMAGVRSLPDRRARQGELGVAAAEPPATQPASRP